MQSLNIVAHPDDDLLFLNPDIICDLDCGVTPYILYLTTGDDGRDEEYVERRRDAAVYAWLTRAGVRQIFWSIKSNCFRQGDKLGDLYQLYRDETYKAISFYGDEVFDRNWFMKHLQELYHSVSPSVIRIQDPFAEPAVESDGPGRDHIDHIYGAKLAVMFLWNANVEMLAYEGYTIRAKEPNVPYELAEKKKIHWRRYQEADTEVAGEQWDIALNRCYKQKL